MTDRVIVPTSARSTSFVGVVPLLPTLSPAIVAKKSLMWSTLSVPLPPMKVTTAPVAALSATRVDVPSFAIFEPGRIAADRRLAQIELTAQCLDHAGAVD